MTQTGSSFLSLIRVACTNKRHASRSNRDMVKKSSTNSSFFKTGGRQAASQGLVHSLKENQTLTDLSPADKQQGKIGQPNFIPSALPVGESADPAPRNPSH